MCLGYCVPNSYACLGYSVPNSYTCVPLLCLHVLHVCLGYGLELLRVSRLRCLELLRTCLGYTVSATSTRVSDTVHKCYAYVGYCVHKCYPQILRVSRLLCPQIIRVSPLLYPQMLRGYCPRVCHTLKVIFFPANFHTRRYQFAFSRLESSYETFRTAQVTSDNIPERLHLVFPLPHLSLTGYKKEIQITVQHSSHSPLPTPSPHFHQGRAVSKVLWE